MHWGEVEVKIILTEVVSSIIKEIIPIPERIDKAPSLVWYFVTLKLNQGLNSWIISSI